MVLSHSEGSHSATYHLPKRNGGYFVVSAVRLDKPEISDESYEIYLVFIRDDQFCISHTCKHIESDSDANPLICRNHSKIFYSQ